MKYIEKEPFFFKIKKSLLFLLLLFCTLNTFSQSVENTTWKHTGFTIDLKTNGRAYFTNKFGENFQGEWKQNDNQIEIKTYLKSTAGDDVLNIYYGNISTNTMNLSLKFYIYGKYTDSGAKYTLYSNNYNNTPNNYNSANNYNSNTDKKHLEEQRRAEDEKKQEEFQKKLQVEQKKKEEFQQMQTEIADLFKSTTTQNNTSFKSLDSQNYNSTSSTQFKTLNTKTDRPQVELNKPFLSPAQKESELKKSKIAYNLGVERIENYDKNKANLEKEVEILTKWIQSVKDGISNFQKDSAKFEYQETIVWYEATNHGSEMEKSVVIQRENNLKQIYGFSNEEIKSLRDEAKMDLKKGVPTLNVKVEDFDKEGEKQDYSQFYDSKTEKTVTIETPKLVDAAGAVLSGIDIGTPIIAGLFEGEYSNRKHKVAEKIQEQKELYKSYTNSMNIKKQQITDMTIEYNNLQKVFNKYGYDIINDTDEYHIIDFGNECRNALNIRIE